jgi:hypothetical protein
MSRWGRAGRYRARLARLVRDWGQQDHWCFDEAERRMQRASRLDGVRPPERFAGRHETLRRELAARQEVRSRTDIEDAARVDLALAASERIDRLLAEIAAEAQTAEEQEYSRALEDLAARRRQEFDRALELADETGRRALGRLRAIPVPEGGEGAHEACLATFVAYLDAHREYRRAVQSRDRARAVEAWAGVQDAHATVSEAFARAVGVPPAATRRGGPRRVPYPGGP